MADESLDKIKKLPAKERVKKLRALETKHKKDLDDTAKLLKLSIEEERRDNVIERVEVPEPQRVDISDLFRSDKDTLEAVISRAVPETADENTVKYELQLDYQILTKLDTEMDRYKLQKTVNQVQGRVNELAQRMDYANVSKGVADQLVATRNVLYSMKKRAGLQ